MAKRRQPSEKPDGGKALAKKLWPASLPSALWGLLKILGAIDSIAFALSLGGELKSVQAFLETSLGAMCLAASLLWAAYILFDSNRRHWAAAALSLGICAVALSAFLLGQQVPPPRVQLRYFDPFTLDETNAPVARISDGLVRMPIRVSAFLPYAKTHRIALSCRPVVEGLTIDNDDFIQVGLFQEIIENSPLEMRIQKLFTDRMCKAQVPAMQCGIIMVKKDVAYRFNEEMRRFRPEDRGRRELPAPGDKNIEHNVYQLRPIPIEGCK